MSKASVAAAGQRGPAAPPLAAAAAVSMPEVVARDTIIAWYRGEFAAANAMIDALCSHLAQIGPEHYDPVFAAIHRRRMNWIPVIHMQKFFSIGDVVTELRRATAACRAEATSPCSASPMPPLREEATVRKVEPADDPPREDLSEEEDRSKVPDLIAATADAEEDHFESPSCEDDQAPVETSRICSNHEDCTDRSRRITIRKGFSAKESLKGHLVNVVKGLKLYEDIFMESELSKLAEFISELHVAARNGDLPGETFIFFNKQLKGNKREIIQLGLPVFQSTKDDEPSHIEAIPPLLQDVIDHLIQWRLIPESRKPNSCIINFFDEDEYSQPYFKPPHLDNPISSLFLYETTVAFGRSLVSDHNGNYKGSLTLSLKQGSLIVMRGNSADVARHVVCPSANPRVTITFLRVRTPSIQTIPPPATTATSTPVAHSKAITLFRPPQPPAEAGAAAPPPASYAPTWTTTVAFAQPVLMLPAPRPVPAVSPQGKAAPRGGGTGVFLPWTVGPKKYVKHLPPRIQRRRLLSLAGPLDVQVDKPSQIPCIVA